MMPRRKIVVPMRCPKPGHSRFDAYEMAFAGKRAEYSIRGGCRSCHEALRVTRSLLVRGTGRAARREVLEGV